MYVCPSVCLSVIIRYRVNEAALIELVFSLQAFLGLLNTVFDGISINKGTFFWNLPPKLSNPKEFCYGPCTGKSHQQLTNNNRFQLSL